MIILFQCKTVDQENSEQADLTFDELLTKANKTYELDDYSRSINLYTQILLVDSTNAEAYYRRAFCKSQLNLDSIALIDFLEAAKYDYRKADCYRNIGIIYAIVLRNDTLATHYLIESYTLNPDPEVAQIINDIQEHNSAANNN